MFVRLTRTRRLRAGWLFALIYLLCVLAPSASFAFGKNVAHCLTVDSFGLSPMQLHKATGAEHVHSDGMAHDHSGMHSIAEKETSSPAKAPHKSSDAQCCGLMCLTALPASLVDIVTLPVLTVVCGSEPLRSVAENAPSRHYRPPIS